LSTNLPSTTFQQPTDTVDLGQVGPILRRRAGMIAIFVFGGTFFALVHVLFAIPQFTVHGALYLGDAQSAGSSQPADSSNLGFLSNYPNRSDVETQIELVTAGALVQHAVLETGLNAQITPSDSPTLTYWRWKLYYGGQTSSFLPGADTLQALYATAAGKYRIVIGQNNAYTLSTRADLLHSSRFVLRGELGKPASGGGTQMLLEPDSANFQAIPGKSYDLDVTSPVALADDLLAGALTVEAGGTVTQPTKIAFLKLRWNNPYQAQRFVNQVMHDYIATQLSWMTESASTTETFVTDQLAHVSASLSQADQNLAAYQSKTGIMDVPQNAQVVINQLAQYQAQRTTVLLQREALQQLDEELHKSRKSLNPYLVSQANDTVLATLTSSLSEAEGKLSQLQVQFTSSSQDVKVQLAQVMEMEDSIRTIVRNDLSAANMNLANLDKIITKFDDQIKQMPAESLKVIALKRSTDVLGQLYVLLMEKEQEAQVSKAATIINTRIVTPADTPLVATSPKAVIMVLFGAFAGLVVGVGLVFGQRAWSGRFESEEQIRAAIRLPVYGAIPRQGKNEIAVSIFGSNNRNPFSESFRLLRRSIYRNTTPGKAMVILIISASKEDGKTTVAANIAKILADDGKRVVLVDGDLHLSRIRGLLNFGSTPGLTDWLATSVQPPISNWPNESFKILPAGTSSISRNEHLNEEALGTIFKKLSSEFDYIILDSPPLPTVSDGLTLGIFADLILSVISVSHTPKRTLNVHNELIDTLNRPHGIIINEVEAQYYGTNDAYFLGETARRSKFAGWFKRD
jgi:tyrosine-protein kinase Etk/Wzc